MVFLSDQQTDCKHSVGVVTRHNAAYLVDKDESEKMFKFYGGEKFEFCPWCGAPVPQIMGDVDK